MRAHAPSQSRHSNRALPSLVGIGSISQCRVYSHIQSHAYLAVLLSRHRLEALRWVHLLLVRARAQVLEALPVLMPALLDALLAQVTG